MNINNDQMTFTADLYYYTAEMDMLMTYLINIVCITGIKHTWRQQETMYCDDDKDEIKYNTSHFHSHQS